MAKKNRKGSIIRSTALRITPMLLAIAITGNWVLSLFQDDIRALKSRQDLDSYEVVETIDEDEIRERVSSEITDWVKDFPEVNFDEINEINPDVQGWIWVAGMDIIHPLFQGLDNAYYIHHNIYGDDIRDGSIFMDYRNKALTNDMLDLSDVIYIYGKHTVNDTMFSSLYNFRNQEYLDEYPFGVLKTESGDVYKLDFFAGIDIGDDEDEVLYTNNFADKEEFNKYYDAIKARSTISKDIDLRLGDKVVALVTYSYKVNNSRFVLFARMTKQLEKEQIEEMNMNNDKTFTA